MRVEVFHDPGEFLLALQPLEAQRDLNFEVLEQARALAMGYGDGSSVMAAVENPGGLRGAVAGVTRERLLLSAMDTPTAEALAQEVTVRGLRPPRLLGPAEPALAFAEQLVTRAAVAPKRLDHLQQLTTRAPLPPPSPPGRLRVARDEDIACLADWSVRFAADLDIDSPAEPHRSMQTYLNFGGVYLWDNGGPTALAMARRSSDRQLSVITYVFTPPEHRGRGYAAALVAELSNRQLKGGSSLCLLYARAEDGAALRLYKRVGYVPSGDFVSVELTPVGVSEASDAADTSAKNV